MKDMKYVQMTIDMMDSDIDPDDLGGVVNMRIYRYLRRLKSLKGR